MQAVEKETTFLYLIVLLSGTCFKVSFEIFSLGVMDVDIIIYRDIYLDKLQNIILYPHCFDYILWDDNIHKRPQI